MGTFLTPGKRRRASSHVPAMDKSDVLVPTRSDLPSPRRHSDTNGCAPRLPYTLYVDHTISSLEEQAPSATKVAKVKDLESVLSSNESSKIKQFLRENSWPVNDEIRGPLWLKLCHLVHRQRASIYSEIFTHVFGKDGAGMEVSLPSFVEPGDLHSYHLTSDGIRVAKSIVCVIGHIHPDITFSPTVFAVTSLFLHYLGEEDTYDCVSSLLSGNQGHITQTKKAYEASKYVLKDLAKKYAKQCYVYIMKQGMVVEGVLEDWMWWIFRDLPFHYLVRVFDCYLFEGPKVLYRVALALMNSFYRHAAKSAKLRGKDVASSSGAKPDHDITRAISQFCEDIGQYVTIDKLMKMAFGLRGLTRKEIKKIQLKSEMFVTSMHKYGFHQAHFQPQGIPHSVSCESLNLQVSRARSSSTPLEYAQAHTQSLLIPAHEHLKRLRTVSEGVIPLSEVQSQNLTLADWQHIYRWIPTRISVMQPHLIYTTEEHGTSLQTFYNRIQDHEQVLIVVKTSNQEVFGAYCSADWRERLDHPHCGYFGTGETFLFTLIPNRKKYEWIGVKQPQGVAASAQLFMAGDNSRFCIGGGDGDGLQLSEGFQTGRTQRCLTFNNSPLAEPADFSITTIEAFEFH